MHKQKKARNKMGKSNAAATDDAIVDDQLEEVVINTTGTGGDANEGLAPVVSSNADMDEEEADLALLDDVYGTTEEKEVEVITDTEENIDEADETETTDEAKVEQGAEETVSSEAVAETVATPETDAEAQEEQLTEAETLTPEETAARLAQFDNEAIDLLSREVYDLSEEQLDALETNPAEAFPRMAAQIHLASMRAATQNVARLLPTLIQQVMETQKTSADLESQFYTAHPALEEHKDVVLRYGQAYRQQFPNSSVADFIRDVGAQAAVGLGLHNVATPAATEVAAVKTVAPHKPAAAGAQRSTPKAVSDNIFSTLAMFEEEA